MNQNRKESGTEAVSYTHLDKVIPSPSVFVCTEHQIYDRSKRKNIVGYQEIFQIHNVCSGAKRLEIREHTEAELSLIHI